MLNGNKRSRVGDKSKIPEEYERLSGKRSEYLTRAEDYSRFTLPYLIPETSPRSGAANQHGFSSIGARAVNHLANKLVLTMFPPQSSFFKLKLSEEGTAKLEGEGFSEIDVAELLVGIEKKVISNLSGTGSRVTLTEGMKHLLVSGNVCLYFPKGQNPSALPLSHYVVSRTPSGMMKVLITLQKRMLSSFSNAEKLAIKMNKPELKEDSEVDLYTKAERDGEFFKVSQSAFDTVLGKEQKIKSYKLPWIPLRWNTCYGEDYGRGLVEDNAGDFQAVEFLAEAQAKGLVLMADVKYLVRPGSVTDIDHLNSSDVGEFISGNPDDISVLQLEKLANFEYIRQAMQDYERRLGHAFMLNSANRRDAERVTAVEIRLDAHELETSLGGIYSLFSETLQKALAYLELSKLDAGLGKDNVSPEIVTGLDALGKADDVDKIAQFSELMLIPASWPEGMQARVKWGDYSRSAAATLGMTTPWLMSDEEFDSQQKQQQEAQQQQTLMQQAGQAAPDLVKEAAGVNK